MDTAISSLRVVHILTAILMAWPFYALVAVNQRARLGPPLGDRVDTFLENTVKNRTIPFTSSRRPPCSLASCCSSLEGSAFPT